MKLLLENWRQYINEVFDTGVETSKPPKKLTGGQNLGYTTFSVNDKNYQIRISVIGRAAAKLWQVEFYRMVPQQPAMKPKGSSKSRPVPSIELLGDSAKEVFAVLSTVFNWALKWQMLNKAKARTMVIAGKDEGKRASIYRRMAEKAASRSGYDVKEVKAIDRSGEEKIVFILFDPKYIEKYPKYKDALNKELETYFNTTV